MKSNKLEQHLYGIKPKIADARPASLVMSAQLKRRP
jgi:hypothetical protein